MKEVAKNKHQSYRTTTTFTFFSAAGQPINRFSFPCLLFPNGQRDSQLDKTTCRFVWDSLELASWVVEWLRTSLASFFPRRTNNSQYTMVILSMNMSWKWPNKIIRFLLLLPHLLLIWRMRVTLWCVRCPARKLPVKCCLAKTAWSGRHWSNAE